MNNSSADNFVAPTVEQVTDHLEQHPPTGPSRLSAWGPLLILGTVALLALASNDARMQWLAWLALGGVVLFWAVRMKRMRDLDRMVVQVQELGMRRYYPQSLRLAWQLLPRLSVIPQLHGRVVAFMAMCLDHLMAYDAAIASYSYLIDRLPGEHPTRVHLQLQRTIAQLANDQLADADDAIRRLRGVIVEQPGTPAFALYRFAQVYQNVRTFHYEEATRLDADLLQTLRPLGVEAGYGHALMALSHLQLAMRDAAEQPEAHRDEARTWWSRATLLLPQDTLTTRYRELQPLLEDATVAAAQRSSSPPMDEKSEAAT